MSSILIEGSIAMPFRLSSPAAFPVSVYDKFKAALEHEREREPPVKHLFIAVVATVTMAAFAEAAVSGTTTISSADRAFVAKVSQGGMFEVAAGAVAATEGSTQDIRDLGTTERHDHTLVGRPDFDRAFVAAMDDIHEKDGSAFAAEASGGSNSQLRAFATETHRIVERHLGALHALAP